MLLLFGLGFFMFVCYYLCYIYSMLVLVSMLILVSLVIVQIYDTLLILYIYCLNFCFHIVIFRFI